MFHCFRVCKDVGGKALALVDKISLSFNVLSFDFLNLSTLYSQVKQLKTVLAYCKENISGKIILLGRSMGGATSLIAAVGNEDIIGIVLWATPISTYDTFINILGESKMASLELNKSIFIDDECGTFELLPSFYKDLVKYDLVEYITNLGRIPKLIIHEEKDEIVPVNQGKKAF